MSRYGAALIEEYVEGLECTVLVAENPALAGRLRDEAAKFFVALNGSGFGRCDFRVDADGTAFMLEINPNCGVYFPKTDPGGGSIQPEGRCQVGTASRDGTAPGIVKRLCLVAPED